VNAGVVRIGERAFATRFSVPSGKAAAVLRELDESALGVARARVAHRLGDPDPFAIRSALAAAPPDAAVEGSAGVPLTTSAVDAALLAADAGADSCLAGLFAGRGIPPGVRAVPVDDARRTWLRWPRRPLRAPTIGRCSSWSTSEIGDEPIATVRCATALPGGGVALGSDYGLTLQFAGRFHPFPWPEGARREARRVEAMAVHRGELVVATSQAIFQRAPGGPVRVRKHGADDEGGWDEVRALLASADRLLVAWRTHLEGAVGPRDTLALAESPGGVVYAGTASGELHVADGGGPIRRFGGDRARPVRHLAFADGALWAAAAGELHRFDGASWSSRPPEPTALAADGAGRLWALQEGALHVVDGGWLRPVPVPLERPWSIAAASGAVWVGGKERVWRIEVG
jgi:hypothetical protein